MKLRELGATRLMFKAIGLGAMPLSIGGRPDDAQAFAVLEAFVADGGNFIDTANVYCFEAGCRRHRRNVRRAGASSRTIV